MPGLSRLRSASYRRFRDYSRCDFSGPGFCITGGDFEFFDVESTVNTVGHAIHGLRNDKNGVLRSLLAVQA